MPAAPQLPERTVRQRREALAQASAVRTQRAALKAELRSGRRSLAELLAEPPACLERIKVAELLRALPGYGPVRVERLLARCRVSPAKTLAGLTARQRSELMAALGHAG